MYEWQSNERTSDIKHIPRIVKTIRPTQLFLYGSGGERRIKCVRPVLEMEARKQEQRGVVLFLVAESAGTRH